MLTGHSVSDANGYILAIDPTVCEILQRSEKNLIGKSYLDITHPNDRDRNVNVVNRLGVLDGPARIRKRYVRPDGSAVWCEVQVSRLNTGTERSLVGTIKLVNRDITTRGPESLWQSAIRIHALIQRRRLELGDDLFSDHGWIVLLQVYLAEAEGRIADIASISERSGLRSELVGRWIRALDQKGLIDNLGCSEGAAQMTAQGIIKMEKLLDWNIEL